MSKITTIDQAAETGLVALELLYESNTPVGNQRLVAALEEAGVVVAEATAGRILRKLVSQGLARTLGKRGRVITPAGRVKLVSLRSTQRRQQRSERLLAASNIADAESLRDMLLVRRAIEPEAARLAALKATDEDIRRLDEFTCAHCLAPMDDGQRVDPAISFHSQLVEASHHKLLIEIGLLVLEQTNTNLLDKISHNPKMTRLTREGIEKDAEAFSKDHAEITEMIRRRDPEGAESTMRLHIDRLLARTAAYLEIISPTSSGE